MPSALPSFRIISIGTLDAHPLWNESTPVRTGHATSTLISVGSQHILVNPGLPAQALAARLSERTPIPVDDITHVFLTSFQPDHRRALPIFDSAAWLVYEPEREAARAALRASLAEAEDGGDAELVAHYQREIETLERCEVAPDSIVPKVDLFPLPGVTAGTCGLLIALPARTVLVCGDAVASIEHLEQGKVLPRCADVHQAQESFKEAIEIADALIPGRDNIIMNPLRQL
jgi:glyoxylase-like metal-dependent hydrolase (beta-lactamase superfamily II)